MKSGRLIYNEALAREGFSEVAVLGRNNNLRAIRPLPRHRHAGCFEILYLAKGTQVWGASGRGYLVGGNDLFITQPDEIHSTGMHPVSKSLFYWMQIRWPVRHGRWFGLPAAETLALVESLQQIPSPRIPGTPAIRQGFETCLKCLGKPTAPLDRVVLRHAVLGLLLEIAACIRSGEAAATSPPIAKVCAAIRRRVQEPLRAEDLTEVAGLSASRLRARFRQEMGIPLGQYILRAKVDLAMELLLQGRSVTEAAYALAFSSSQYFATVFKRYTMQTPSAYLQSLCDSR